MGPSQQYNRNISIDSDSFGSTAIKHIKSRCNFFMI